MPAPPAPTAQAFEFRAEPTTQSDSTAEPEPQREPIAIKQRVHFSASEATLKKLQRARELARGQNLDAIIEKALDALLEKCDPMQRNQRREQRAAKRTAAPTSQAPKPAKPKASAPSNRFPIAVKDAAHASSGGQCTYIARTGRRCTSRTFGEYDHIHPASLGGADTLENARHLCSAHHAMFTRRTFSQGSRAPAGRH